MIDGPHRFEVVMTIGAHEHVWRPTRKGEKYLAPIIDLAPIVPRRRPAKLSDLIDGRSVAVF